MDIIDIMNYHLNNNRLGMVRRIVDQQMLDIQVHIYHMNMIQNLLIFHLVGSFDNSHLLLSIDQLGNMYMLYDLRLPLFHIHMYYNL